MTISSRNVQKTVWRIELRPHDSHTRVNECVLGLVISLAAGVVGVVVAVVSTLSGCVVLDIFEIVLETHCD